MIALLIGLVLSAYNLSLMTSASGRATGLDAALTQAQQNYAERRVTPTPPPPPPAACPQQRPPALFAVVKFREGEEASLRANLVAPLMQYYEGRQPALLALLIERKNASSRDVNVRMFFSDGTETSYLWPSTHSSGGVWTQPEEMTQ